MALKLHCQGAKDTTRIFPSKLSRPNFDFSRVILIVTGTRDPPLQAKLRGSGDTSTPYRNLIIRCMWSVVRSSLQSVLNHNLPLRSGGYKNWYRMLVSPDPLSLAKEGARSYSIMSQNFVQSLTCSKDWLVGKNYPF